LLTNQNKKQKGGNQGGKLNAYLTDSKKNGWKSSTSAGGESVGGRAGKLESVGYG